MNKRLRQAARPVRIADLRPEATFIVDAATVSHGGSVVKFLGDGSMLAFESARAAVRTAIEIQKATVDAPFSVRIGVHTGEVQRTARDLFGLTVNKASPQRLVRVES